MNTFHLCFVALLSTCVFSQTRTKTFIEYGGRLSLDTIEFSDIQFTNPYIYPKPYFAVKMTDSTGAERDVSASDGDIFNSFVIDEHPMCRPMLAEDSVDHRSSPWDDSFLSATDIKEVFEFVDVVVPGVGGEPERIEKQPAARSYELQIGISAKPEFWYEISNAETGTYDLRVPASCTRLNSRPSPVSFVIRYGARSAIGRVMTYLMLAASTLALHNVLSGSLISLTLLQQFAIVNSNGCGPLTLQEEAHIEFYTINPIQVTTFRSISPWMMKLLTSLMIVSAAWTLEGFHWLFTQTKNRRKAQSILAEQDEEMKIKSLEREVRRKQGVTEMEEHSDENIKSPSTEEDNEVARGLSKYEPKDSDFVYVQAPYLAIGLTLALMNGVVYNSVKVIFNSDVRWQQLIAVIGICTHGLLPFIIVIGISRVKDLIFVPYLRSYRGSIPRWLQPSGVWGSNKLRLTIGPFVEDFKSSRRLFGLLIFLHQFLLTVIHSAASSSTESSCRNTYWFGLMANLVYLLLVYYVAPFRSPFLNAGYSIQLFTLCLHYGMLTAWGGYIHDVNSWTHTGVYATGIIFNAVSFLFTLGNAFVARWEFVKEKAVRHVSQNMEFVGQTKVETQTTEEVIEDLLQIFSKDGEERREKETMRQQVVPLEEDDTAAVRYFVEAPREVGDDEEEPQLTLADYLLQDMDRLPDDTKAQFHLEQELHIERRKNAKKLNVNLSMHPDDEQKARLNPNYIAPRKKPLNIQAFEVHKEKPIPSVFVQELDRVRASKERSESPDGTSYTLPAYETSPLRRHNGDSEVPLKRNLNPREDILL